MLKSDDLISKIKTYNKFLNPETLNKAYDFIEMTNFVHNISKINKN